MGDNDIIITANDIQFDNGNDFLVYGGARVGTTLGVGGTNPVLYTVDVTGTGHFTGMITASGGVTGALTGNASTATALATPRTINGVSFDGTGNIIVTATDNKADVYALLGSVIKAEPVMGGLNILNATIAQVSTQFAITAVYLPKAATITGVKWYQSVAGNYTANNYNGVGLYTYSGGTLTLVASSTDDGNIWKATSNTWSSKAFSATYAAAAGLYFIGEVYNSSAQTTAPSFGGTVQAVNAGVVVADFTNSAKLVGLLAAQTSLPASTTMAAISTTNVRY
jgi:hypothetical protein